MIRKAPAMTIRQNLGEILNGVQFRKDSVLITKGGKAVAALVDVELFQRMRLLEEEYARLSKELQTAYNGVNEEIALAEINDAVKAVRKRGGHRG